MTEAAGSPETSVYIYQPKMLHIPENSYIYKIILDVDVLSTQSSHFVNAHSSLLVVLYKYNQNNISNIVL